MLKPYITELRRLARNAFAAYGLAFIWVMTVILGLALLVGPPAVLGGIEPLSLSMRWMFAVPGFRVLLMQNPAVMAFMGLVFAPLVEEAVFRMLPLALVEYRSPRLVRAIVICVCGILFGYMHGSPINVFIQGFVGMTLGFLYLKNGPNQLSSYLTCAAVHAAYNFTMLSIAIATGAPFF